MTFPLLSNLQTQSGMSLTAFQALLGLRNQTWNDFINGKPVPPGLLRDAQQWLADREYFIESLGEFLRNEVRNGVQLPPIRVLRSALEEAMDLAAGRE